MTLNASPASVLRLVFAPEDRDAALALRDALRDLGARVQSADDEAAAHLAVLCSPAAADCLSVSEQILAFVKTNGRTRILPVLLGEDLDAAALPAPLRFARGEDRLLAPVEPPPIAARLDGLAPEDLRRAAAAILAAAGLTPAGARGPVTPPWRAAGWAAAAALVLAVAGLAIHSGELRGELREARHAAEEAGAFSSAVLAYMTETLPGAARQQALAALGEQALAALGDPDAAVSDAELARRARLIGFIAEARDLSGDRAGAREAFETAHAISGRLLDLAPADPERLLAHAESAAALGASAYRLGDIAGAGEALETNRRLVEALVRLEPDEQGHRLRLAHASVNAGVIALERGAAAEALLRFQDAVARYQDGLAGGGASLNEAANAMGWVADAERALGRHRAAEATRASQVAAFEAAAAAEPDDARLALRLANARRYLALLRLDHGALAEAAELLDAASTDLARLAAADPENIRIRRLHMAVERDRAEAALLAGDLIRAKLVNDAARRLRAARDDQGADDGRRFEIAGFDLVAARIALASGVFEAALADAAAAAAALESHVGEGRERYRHAAAGAHLIHGEALLSLGRGAEAARAFRAARTHIEALEQERDRRADDIYSRALWRLGEREAAAALRDALLSDGYARPDFIAFWTAPGAALSVQQAQTGDEDHG